MLVAMSFNRMKLFDKKGKGKKILLLGVGDKFYKTQTMLKLIQDSYNMDDLIHWPIRPRVDSYDKLYYSENLQAYLDRANHCDFESLQPFEGTIEQFLLLKHDILVELKERGYEIIYYMNDVTYYLRDLIIPEDLSGK